MKSDTQKYLSVTLNRASSLIETLWAADENTPVILLGPTGVGKSDLMQEIRSNLEKKHNQEIGFVDFRAGQREASDLMGVMMPEDGRTTYLCPSDIPFEANSRENLALAKARKLVKQKTGKELFELTAADKKSVESLQKKIMENDPELGGFPERGIFFLDEVKHAAPDMQNALFGLVLDRRIGENKLMDGWHIALAGNRASEQTYEVALNEPLRARLAFLFIEPNTQEWAEWASRAGLRSEVSTFLTSSQEPLHQGAPDGEGAFPCGRKWAAVARLLDVIAPLNDAGDVTFKNITNDRDTIVAVASFVGTEAAVQFLAYMQLLADESSITQYSIEEIFADPQCIHDAIQRSQPGPAWALVSRIINYGKSQEYDDDYMYKAFKFFCHMEVWKEAQDISRYALTALKLRDPEAMSRWMVNRPEEAEECFDLFESIYEYASL